MPGIHCRSASDLNGRHSFPNGGREVACTVTEHEEDAAERLDTASWKPKLPGAGRRSSCQCTTADATPAAATKPDQS